MALKHALVWLLAVTGSALTGVAVRRVMAAAECPGVRPDAGEAASPASAQAPGEWAETDGPDGGTASRADWRRKGKSMRRILGRSMVIAIAALGALVGTAGTANADPPGTTCRGYGSSYFESTSCNVSSGYYYFRMSVLCADGTMFHGAWAPANGQSWSTASCAPNYSTVADFWDDFR